MVDQVSFCFYSSLVFKVILNPCMDMEVRLYFLLDCMNSLCNFLYIRQELIIFSVNYVFFGCKLVAHGISPSVFKGACCGQ